VRGGAERAELAAEFDLDPRGALAAWLAERDLGGDPGQVILRRTVDGSAARAASSTAMPPRWPS